MKTNKNSACTVIFLIQSRRCLFVFAGAVLIFALISHAARGQQSLDELMRSAEQGDSFAQFGLGALYEEGTGGLSQNYTEAAKWYRKAPEKDLSLAQTYLGRLYAKGLGVPQSYTEALRWLHKAAEAQEPNACCELGLMCATGQALAQNYEEALKWYRKAADQGHGCGQRNMGLMYLRGIGGVPQDLKEARAWFKKAALQGDADAQFDLGVMCGLGQGGKKDGLEAIKWLRRSAKQGHKRAVQILKELKDLNEPLGR